MKVNEFIITNLAYKVDVEREKVFVEGRKVKPLPKVYYLFYKPRGFLISLYDLHHRQTIRVFLKKLPYQVFPVGRLDKDRLSLDKT